MSKKRHSANAANYKGYLVRIWRSSARAPWRAFAHDTLTGKEHHFAKLEKLLLFLRDETRDADKSDIP